MALRERKKNFILILEVPLRATAYNMEIQIIEYQPLYKDDFKRINVERSEERRVGKEC